MAKMWTLDEGLKLVRALQEPSRQYGYHLTLGGSVLNRGESEKDLDLYFIPLCNPKLAKSDPGGLLTWLSKLWGKHESIGKDYGEQAEIAPVQYRQVVKQDIPMQFMNRAINDYLDYKVQRVSYDIETTKPKPSGPPSPYRHKVKFDRGSDRVDVFILAG